MIIFIVGTSSSDANDAVGGGGCGCGIVCVGFMDVIPMAVGGCASFFQIHGYGPYRLVARREVQVSYCRGGTYHGAWGACVGERQPTRKIWRELCRAKGKEKDLAGTSDRQASLERFGGKLCHTEHIIHTQKSSGAARRKILDHDHKNKT